MKYILMFPNTTIIQNTTNNYLPTFQKFNPTLYLFILLFIIISLIALPFVHIAIGVTSQGIIRPLSERTEVKPIISGIIDSLYYREGIFIFKALANCIILGSSYAFNVYFESYYIIIYRIKNVFKLNNY